MDVDKLTDAELRMKLIEFGFPVMPITGTTRKIMVKKLKMLMENKSKINAENRRSLAKYSSGEDSDVEPPKSATKAATKRRQTMAAPSANQQPVVSSTKKSVSIQSKVVTAHNSDSTTSNEVPFSATKRQTRGGKMVQMAEESIDVSDSDPDISEMEASLAKSRSGKSPASSSLKGNRKDTPIKTPDNDIRKTSRFESFSSYRTSTPTAGYSSPISSGGGSGDAGERLQQIRSRLSLGTSPYSSPSTLSYSNYPRTDLNTELNDSPFLSNFTRKLSRLSANPTALLNDGVKEHDTNGASAYSRYIARNPKYDQNYGANYNAGPSDNSKSRSNLVSFALIAVAFLFFIVVTVLYLGLHSGNTAIDITGLHIPYCTKEDSKSQRFSNCVFDSDVKPAVEMYRLIKPELVRRTVQKACHGGDEDRIVGEDTLVVFAETRGNGEYDAAALRKHIRSFAILTLHNPKWDIALTTNPSLLTPLSPTENLPQPKLGFAQEPLYMYAKEPELPFMCRWRLRLDLAFRALAVLLSFGGLGYLARRFYTKHQLEQRRRRDEVFLLVERIVELLQTTAEAALSTSMESSLQTQSTQPQDFLVINHVRDMLLPINDRERMEKTWNDAVKFLGENESRVRTEVQVVRGEQYEVWRWVGNSNTSGASPSSPPRTANKSWQGQAFETQAGSVNSLPCSPTPCLKVRGMLNNNNTSDSNTAATANVDDPTSVSVREAVLAKCAQRCQLLHCAVDQATSAIYLKCQSQADAAVAYRALHGWWYAGHLVTVKYLRLERYVQRFPDAPTTGPPYLRALHPAGDWSN